MKKKTVIYAVILLAVVVGAYWIVSGRTSSGNTTYQFGVVTRGTVESTVSATGTVTPVTTVDIGTQISGTIDSVYVDYNDHVTAGQVLAVLDTTLLKSTLLDAEASLARSEAELMQAQANYERNKSLFDRQLISDAEFLTFRVNLRVQEATVRSSEAAVQRARRNIDLAVIQSPITGIVVSRNIESGQTVAASLSSPILFVIAEDLSRMEVLANVDESDIGLIKADQEVRFEVASYSDKQFTGTVRQVRLQPQTISNVVTYTVVVEAGNDEGLLLPGMTATMNFVTERRSDVLVLPSKALRFQPSEDQLAALAAPTGKIPGSDNPAETTPVTAIEESGSTPAMAWCVDAAGRLVPAPLRVGLSDGARAEILHSPVLTEGMEVIIGQGNASSATTSSTQAGSSGRMGPPPFGM